MGKEYETKESKHLFSKYLKFQALEKSYDYYLDQYKKAYASYANEIVTSPSKADEYLEQARSFKTMLDNLHNQIINAFKEVKGKYDISIEHIEGKHKDLDDIYKELISKKYTIKGLLNEQTTLDNVSKDNNYKLDSTYIYYRILLFIAVILLVYIFYNGNFYFTNLASTNAQIMKGGGSMATWSPPFMRFNIILLALMVIFIDYFFILWWAYLIYLFWIFYMI